MNYRISKQAANDLEKIWIYTYDNWSTQQADKYINLLIDEFEFLAKNPNSGSDFGHLRKGYLRSKVKSHFVFYRVMRIKGQKSA